MVLSLCVAFRQTTLLPGLLLLLAVVLVDQGVVLQVRKTSLQLR
jgi:hypothetical protein